GLAIGFVWLFVSGYHAQAIQVMTGLLILSGVLALLSAVVAWAWIEEPSTRLGRWTIAELLHLHRGIVERARLARARVAGVIDLTRGPPERLPPREYLFLVALGVMSIGFDIFYGPFPVFLWQGAHFTDAGVFIVYLGSAAASTALFFHSGKAVERHSPKSLFLGSPALLAWLALLNALLGVTWAFISTASTLFLVRLVGRSARGRALGLYNAVAGAGGLIGTLLGGWMYASYGVHIAYSVAAVTVIAGAALLLPIPYHVFLVPQRAAAHHRHLVSSARAVTRPPRR